MEKIKVIPAISGINEEEFPISRYLLSIIYGLFANDANIISSVIELDQYGSLRVTSLNEILSSVFIVFSARY
jgi:hypothetical protein